MSQKLRVHIDFETRSAIDLKKSGAHVYAQDASTDVLCLAIGVDDQQTELWRLGDYPPLELFEMIKSGAHLIAHNAAFESLIWEGVCVGKYGWPRLPLENLYCTMAQCYAMGLPGSLENAAKAMGIDKQKDMAGHRIMMQLSQPREFLPDGKVLWWRAEDAKDEKDLAVILDKFEKLYAYCLNDVDVERELFHRLVPLSPTERMVWLLDQRINSRGVALDSTAARGALQLVEHEKKFLNQEMQRITSGQVATVNAVAQLKEWLSDYGASRESLAKAEVSEMLEDEGLPDICRAALQLRRTSAKSSVAKLQAMMDGLSADGRVRGCFQYHGANTGRWAGRRLQLHNLPRESKFKPHEIEAILELLIRHQNRSVA